MKPPTSAAPVRVWHRGEQTLQAEVGMSEHMAAVGDRVIRTAMPDQHRDFFATLPFAVLGTVDAAGDAWATLVTGEPGFLSAPTPTLLHLDIIADPTDPASEGLTVGAGAAVLGIDFGTRRRNRANGTLQAPLANGFDLRVEQSFGNCPQYIQRRRPRWQGDPGSLFTGEVETATVLDPPARKMIESADTFFVASYADRDDGGRDVDVSHRGGESGFVRLDGDGALTIPDFSGNLFFATLGNILLNGRAGLVFVDFETGDIVQLTGDAEIQPIGSDMGAFAGAERLWRFMPRRMVRRRAALPLRWS